MRAVKKKLFFFDVPVYDREICVIVGMNHKEALEAAKKQKCTPSFMKAMQWEDLIELCNKVNDKDCETEGAALRANDTRYFLVLKPYKNDWKYLDCLNHEVFHIVQFMGHIIKFWDDVEPPAYLQSWLFKELRRALSGKKK